MGLPKKNCSILHEVTYQYTDYIGKQLCHYVFKMNYKIACHYRFHRVSENALKVALIKNHFLHDSKADFNAKSQVR